MVGGNGSNGSNGIKKEEILMAGALETPDRKQRDQILELKGAAKQICSHPSHLNQNWRGL